MTRLEKIQAAVKDLSEMTLEEFVNLAPQGWAGSSPLVKFIREKAGDDSITETLPINKDTPYVVDHEAKQDYLLPEWTREFADRFQTGMYPNLVEGVPRLEWEKKDLEFLSFDSCKFEYEKYFVWSSSMIILSWMLKTINLYRAGPGLLITKYPIDFMRSALNYAMEHNLDLSFNFHRMEITTKNQTIHVVSRPKKVGLCRAILINNVDVGNWYPDNALSCLGKIAIIKEPKDTTHFQSGGWKDV